MARADGRDGSAVRADRDPAHLGWRPRLRDPFPARDGAADGRPAGAGIRLIIGQVDNEAPLLRRPRSVKQRATVELRRAAPLSAYDRARLGRPAAPLPAAATARRRQGRRWRLPVLGYGRLIGRSPPPSRLNSM